MAERVSELLRLANRLHETQRDPVERKRALLDGLVAMTAADRGECAVVHDNGGPAPVILSSAGHDRALITHLVTAVREAARGGHAHARAAPVQWQPSPVITALVRLDQRNTFGGIALSRHGDHEPFARDDHDLVRLFHVEMAWVYELDLPLASPDVISLPPRPRETLQYLLAGLSEKQIAVRLGLSHNTVHHYVKQLYRHFKVSSRSELLARWVSNVRPAMPA